MNVARRINNWIAYLRAVNELGGLNSRILADIGVVREQIPALARASVR